MSTSPQSDLEVVHEPERDKIKDLDELPLPARHLLDRDLAVWRAQRDAMPPDAAAYLSCLQRRARA